MKRSQFSRGTDLRRGLLAERLGHSLDVERDDRSSGRHRFQYDVGHSFPGRRHDHYVGRRQLSGNIVAPAAESNAVLKIKFRHAAAQSRFQRSRAKQQQIVIRQTGEQPRRIFGPTARLPFAGQADRRIVSCDDGSRSIRAEAGCDASRPSDRHVHPVGND